MCGNWWRVYKVMWLVVRRRYSFRDGYWLCSFSSTYTTANARKNSRGKTSIIFLSYNMIHIITLILVPTDISYSSWSTLFQSGCRSDVDVGDGRRHTTKRKGLTILTIIFIWILGSWFYKATPLFWRNWLELYSIYASSLCPPYRIPRRHKVSIYFFYIHFIGTLVKKGFVATLIRLKNIRKMILQIMTLP